MYRKNKLYEMLLNHYESDVMLHMYLQCSYLNMNAFGDDYVSFTAMDLSLSPDGNYLLVSTGMILHFLFNSVLFLFSFIINSIKP